MRYYEINGVTAMPLHFKEHNSEDEEVDVRLLEDPAKGPLSPSQMQRRTEKRKAIIKRIQDARTSSDEKTKDLKDQLSRI